MSEGEEDDVPISKQVPRTDGYKTIVDKARIPRWLYGIFVPESDLMKLFYFFMGMLIMFAIIGAWEFGFCRARNEETTFMQCVTHNEPKAKRK